MLRYTGARNPLRRVRRLLLAVLRRLRRQRYMRRALPAIPATARSHRSRVGRLQRVDVEPNHLPRLQPGLPSRVRHPAALRVLSAGDRRVETATSGVVRRRPGRGGSPESGRGSRSTDGGHSASERHRHTDVSHRRRLIHRRDVAERVSAELTEIIIISWSLRCLCVCVCTVHVNPDGKNHNRCAQRLITLHAQHVLMSSDHTLETRSAYRLKFS